ncbi:hypothetical protein L910_2801 [Vibrio fluvialis PG41]|uniref:Uncharacterized protein n=1 Tax=Vibrio fluvialis PG41 TaxID=1336752 RepID=S7HVN4_VIBFL|nr:hypothetical protein L910_2801 [Vibrio fluvialis PG41]
MYEKKQAELSLMSLNQELPSGLVMTDLSLITEKGSELLASISDFANSNGKPFPYKLV